MALDDLLTAGFAVAGGIGGEEIEYLAADYPQALRVTAIFDEFQPPGEIVNDFGADRVTMMLSAADFEIDGWGTVTPARRDIIYRRPDDIPNRETWAVKKNPRLSGGIYIFAIEKDGRVVPR